MGLDWPLIAGPIDPVPLLTIIAGGKCCYAQETYGLYRSSSSPGADEIPARSLTDAPASLPAPLTRAMPLRSP
jgi:hypothetical protein